MALLKRLIMGLRLVLNQTAVKVLTTVRTKAYG